MNLMADKTLENQIISELRIHRTPQQAIKILKSAISKLTQDKNARKILQAKDILTSYKANNRRMRALKLQANDLDQVGAKARERCFLIKKAIRQLDDNQERIILEDFYINGLTMIAIAMKLHVDERESYRIKNRALINFSDICRVQK